MDKLEVLILLHTLCLIVEITWCFATIHKKLLEQEFKQDLILSRLQELFMKFRMVEDELNSPVIVQNGKTNLPMKDKVFMYENRGVFPMKENGAVKRKRGRPRKVI